MNMDADVQRFKRIIKGKIKEELKKFISSGDLITRQGKKTIKIPLPRVNIPKFQLGSDEQKGLGQGEGAEGENVPSQAEEGKQKAGQAPGERELETDLSFDQLAELLGEELELPRITPRNQAKIEDQSIRYNSIMKSGPESLHHFRRTYKTALKRAIETGDYNPDDPIIVPMKEDKRYRGFSFTSKPIANAVIIYMMDVSGSMGDEQKEVVRLTSFWLDTWLTSQYKGLERRFIIHDATAREVDQETFFRTKESGGTLISSAYKLARKLVEDEYSPNEWNIYFFHFSDGDNWSGNDTAECVNIIEKNLLPACNLFCYGQVESRYGSGQFYRDLAKVFGEKNDKIISAQIKDREAILDALRAFLAKGR